MIELVLTDKHTVINVTIGTMDSEAEVQGAVKLIDKDGDRQRVSR